MNERSSSSIILRTTTIHDVDRLQALGSETFLETHRTSAPIQDLQHYIEEKYNLEAITAELQDSQNIFSLLYYDDSLAGYSKLILGSSYEGEHPVAHLDRFYLLGKFCGIGLGSELLEYNVKLAIQNRQASLWLNVWSGNVKAIQFYERKGFEIVKATTFKISERHSNDCLHMLRRL